MATVNVPSIGLSYRIKWLFPIGAVLSASGVVLNAIPGLPDIQTVPNWAVVALSRASFPLLLIGSAFVLIGSFLDRQRLAARNARLRGILCWVASAVCFTLLRFLDNQGWTFALIFPAFAGLIAGLILVA